MNEEKKQQVIALGRLGWSLRRIQRVTGVHRETAAAYLKAAGIAFRPPGSWGRQPAAKPANEVITDPVPEKPATEVAAPERPVAPSAAEPPAQKPAPQPLRKTGPCVIKPVMSDEDLVNCGGSASR